MEALELHFLTNIEPELEQVNAISDDHSLEIRGFRQECLNLLWRAELHDALNTGTVIPGAVEGDEFAGRWEKLHIALEIPLATFGSVGLGSATLRAVRGFMN